MAISNGGNIMFEGFVIAKMLLIHFYDLYGIIQSFSSFDKS